MSYGKHPCDLCDKCRVFDCVHYARSNDEYCINYDCVFEIEGLCTLNMASRCAVSSEFKMEEEND